MDDKGKRKQLDDRRVVAEELHKKLLGFSWTKEQLGNPETVVCVETFVAHPFHHMGRALTRDLIDFIGKRKCQSVTAVPGRKLPLLPHEYGFRFITGAPGGGKSCSVATGVSFLYAKFARERERSSPPGPVRRIVLIAGGAIARAPADALWEGLFQAFADDEDALLELESRPEGQVSAKHVERFVSRRTQDGDGDVELTIVVDDGNKFGKESPGYRLLRSLVKSCVVVICTSISSEWVQMLRHPKVQEIKMVPAEFSAAELSSYVNQFDYSGVDISRAGKNPRLLELANFKPAIFISALNSLENELWSFLLKVSQQMGLLERVRQELCCAGEVPEFPILLESRCFYRGENRELVAITPYIAGFARARLTQLIAQEDIQKGWDHVFSLVQSIAGDSNPSRIGLNAEWATMCCMQYMTEGFFYATDQLAVMKTKRPRYFEGQMSRRLLTSQRPRDATAHIPLRFNHVGLDFYLEDDRYLVAVQVATGKNPLTSHRHTVDKAEELFLGDDRVKILVWVIHTSKWESYKVKSKTRPGLGYYTVLMPFGSFCQKLAGIDNRLDELRRNVGRKAEEVCGCCGTADRYTEWVQCDACDVWWHQKCVCYTETNVTVDNLFEEKIPQGDGVARSDVHSTTEIPFVCIGCGSKPS